jgi:Predicted hydrolases or acyltransferases (alpha/beta hydrolase superfamily)
MCALVGRSIALAYFISPIVDMERIEGVTLNEEYQRYIRQHPIRWRVPTHILYGENDNLTSFGTISDFASRTGATLTVMPGGEHWFHTSEQMAFLDEWIMSKNKLI